AVDVCHGGGRGLSVRAQPVGAHGLAFEEVFEFQRRQLGARRRGLLLPVFGLGRRRRLGHRLEVVDDDAHRGLVVLREAPAEAEAPPGPREAVAPAVAVAPAPRPPRPVPPPSPPAANPPLIRLDAPKPRLLAVWMLNLLAA